MIRDSHEQDVGAIQAIYAHHVLQGVASFEEVPPDMDEIRRRRRDVLDRGLPHLVVEQDRRVLGFAYAAPYRLRTAYRFTLEDSIYLAPDVLGKGHGRALLRRLVELCSQDGFRQMVAVIGDSGNAASIALHASLGFERVGLLTGVGFKFGGWVDSVLMQRPLGPGNRTLPPPGPNHRTLPDTASPPS